VTITKIKNLYWWKGSVRTNFGDILSPIIIKKMFGYDVRHCERNTTNKMLAIGSVLQLAKTGDIVWGTGFIGSGLPKAEEFKLRPPKHLKVFAVRGPKTREVLLGLNIDCPQIYGDPGILLPKIFSSYLETPKKYNVGIIPHFVDYKKIKSYFKNEKKINIINILDGVEKVLLESTKCEILFSSSLHGIILGESFQIPTGWITVGGKLGGGNFKFEDYYLSTDREKPTKIDWTSGPNIDLSKKILKSVGKPNFNFSALINSFPHKEFV
jgi:pyruvyltransferase